MFGFFGRYLVGGKIDHVKYIFSECHGGDHSDSMFGQVISNLVNYPTR